DGAVGRRLAETAVLGARRETGTAAAGLRPPGVPVRRRPGQRLRRPLRARCAARSGGARGAPGAVVRWTLSVGPPAVARGSGGWGRARGARWAGGRAGGEGRQRPRGSSTGRWGGLRAMAAVHGGGAGLGARAEPHRAWLPGARCPPAPSHEDARVGEGR